MSIDPSIPPVPPASTDPVPNPSASAEPYASPAAAAAPATAATGENTVAVVCYLTIVGFIIALVMNKDEKKNRLGQFHLRQMLGLIILGVALGIVMNIGGLIFSKVAALSLLFTFVTFGIYMVLLGAWIFGFIAALQRQEKPIPVIGPIIQQKLATVFAS